MKILFSIVIFFILNSISLIGSPQSQELPNEASDFIKKNFSEYRILKYKYDSQDNEYKINLESGHELKFRSDGQWIDIQGDYTPIPKSVIDQLPSGILTYISKNYPRKTIIRIKLKDYGYKIELAKSVDLKFTKQGNFIKED